MRVGRRAGWMAVAAIGLTAPAVQADILRVDAAAPAEGDGASWETAYRDLQSALGSAHAGDEIRVAQGLYRPTSTTDRSVAFVLASGVKLLGGYRGAFTGGGNPDERNPSVFVSTLSGEIGSATIEDNSFNVLRFAEGGEGIVLDGVTVEAGRAVGNDSQSGAGIRSSGAVALIKGCVIRNNTAAGSGAGLWGGGGTLTIADSTFSGNAASTAAGSAGGGMALVGTNATVNGSTFLGNTMKKGGHIAATGGVLSIGGSTFLNGVAISADGMGGGAIASMGAALTVDGSLLQGNTANVEGGGAIDAKDGSLAIDGCIFTSNTSVRGGAIRSSSLTGHRVRNSVFNGNKASSGGFAIQARKALTVEGCTFNQNTVNGTGATTGGAIAVLDQSASPATTQASLRCSDSRFFQNAGTGKFGGACYATGTSRFDRCTFGGNTALNGGAAYLVDAVGEFNSCILSGNSATSGGGIATKTAALDLNFCSICRNTASSAGGGVHLTGDGALVRMRGSILWENVANGAMTFIAQVRDLQAGSPEYSHAIVMAWPGASPDADGNTGENPLLSDPDGADNAIGTIDDDLSLLPGSPAIDSGANAILCEDAFDADGDGNIAEFLPFDAKGGQRCQDDPAAADLGCGIGPIIDRGAVERGGLGTIARRGDLSGDGYADATDLAILLSAWGLADSCELADLSRNGSVDVVDLITLLGDLWKAAER